MDLSLLDLGNITLVGLAIIGVVNAVTFFKPDLDSRAKFLISVVVALIIGFVPADLGNEILNRLVTAITAASVASGGYKISQKLGGK